MSLASLTEQTSAGQDAPGLPLQSRVALLEPVELFDEEALARALHRLADAGWNGAILPLFLHGYPVFPSQAWARWGLRRQHPRFRKWDPLELATAIGEERGLDLSVLSTPYLASSGAGRLPPLLRKHRDWSASPHPQRRKRLAAGLASQRYFCPVNPEYRRFLADTLHEVFEGFPFQGLLLDLKHYPFFSGGESDYALYCYCDACREATLRDLGFDPAGVDFSREQTMVRRWKEWQARQLDDALVYLRLRVLKARRTLRIMGLLTSTGGDRPTGLKPLIHWKSWVENSLVESLVLDGYDPDPETFRRQVGLDIETLSPQSVLMPMLPRKAEDGRQFLDVYDERPLPGLTSRFEDWARPEFDPRLRVRFEGPALGVESDPLGSIHLLFLEIAEHVPGHQLGNFLGDLSYILRRDDIALNVERLLMVAANIEGLLEKVRTGSLELGRHTETVARHLDLAYRLVFLAGSDLKE